MKSCRICVFQFFTAVGMSLFVAGAKIGMLACQRAVNVWEIARARMIS